MTDSELNPAEVSVRLATVLEQARVPYAIGGAIAYGFWGSPRGTYDIDVNLFLAAGEARPALEALAAAGLEVDIDAALRSGVERGDARGYYSGIPVDLFFVAIPLHDSAAQRTVSVELMGIPIQILSAEDIALFKLLFFRGKDIVDLQRLVAVQGARLDRDYVRCWLIDCVGDGDVRVEQWDRICAALPST